MKRDRPGRGNVRGWITNEEMKMERTVAVKKLGKMLGKKLAYRIDAKAPSQDERDEAKAALAPAIAERNELKEQREARYRALLADDAEYQRLHAATSAASKRVDELSSITRHHKFTVGTSEGIFFVVKAEGDSWEEIIVKLTTKTLAAA